MLQVVKVGLDRPAVQVLRYHNQAGTESPGGEFDAADLRRGNDLSGNADDKEVAKALIEDDLYRDPGVRAADDPRNGSWTAARVRVLVVVAVLTLLVSVKMASFFQKMNQLHALRRGQLPFLG